MESTDAVSNLVGGSVSALKVRPERVVLNLPVPDSNFSVPVDPGDDTDCACVLCSASVGPVVPSSFPDLVFLVVPPAASFMLSETLDSPASLSAPWPGAAAGAEASMLAPELGEATAVAAAACLSSGVGAASRLNLTDLLVLLALLFLGLVPSAAAF